MSASLHVIVVQNRRWRNSFLESAHFIVKVGNGFVGSTLIEKRIEHFMISPQCSLVDYDDEIWESSPRLEDWPGMFHQIFFEQLRSWFFIAATFVADLFEILQEGKYRHRVLVGK